MSDEPTVTMDELAVILGDEAANDLWALILKNRRPKPTLTPKQVETALAVLEGRSKGKGDYEILGKAVKQYADRDMGGAQMLFNFLRGGDNTEPITEAVDHPAMRYGRQAAPRQEEAPAEAPASKRSPRRGPRPV